MEVQDYYKKTVLQIVKDDNKKRIKFKIEGDTMNKRPAILYVTFAKSKVIKDAMFNHIKKLNGEEIRVYNEWWLIPQQCGEIFMDLQADKDLIRFNIENGSDDYGYGTIFLTKDHAKSVVQEITSII